MSGSNYPPGTWEGDPRAPWNEPDAPECGAVKCGAVKEWDDDAEEWRCPEGHDEEPELTAEDIAYLRAENSMEWEERHGGGL